MQLERLINSLIPPSPPLPTLILMHAYISLNSVISPTSLDATHPSTLPLPGGDPSRHFALSSCTHTPGDDTCAFAMRGLISRANRRKHSCSSVHMLQRKIAFLGRCWRMVVWEKGESWAANTRKIPCKSSLLGALPSAYGLCICVCMCVYVWGKI